MYIKFKSVEGHSVSAVSPTIKLIEDPKGTCEITGIPKYSVVIGESNNFWSVTAKEFAKLQKQFGNEKNAY